MAKPKNPKISVVIPVYNVEKYLSRCVESLLSQTFTDFEIILVDDGSYDNSGKICDDYAAVNNNIRVIHKANGGISDARNCGIDNAKGEYLSFIDSDDSVAARFLEVLYSNAKKYDVDISVVNLHKEYDEYAEPPFKVEEGVYSRRETINNLYTNNDIYINSASNKLYKADIFNSFRFPIGKTHEDGFIVYKLLYTANRVHFSNEDLYCYYQRSNSVMNSGFSISRLNEYYVYLERRQFFLENSMEELFIRNESYRLGCMKTMSVWIVKSDIEKYERNKIFRNFKKDFADNIKPYIISSSLMQRIKDAIFALSPWLFAKIAIMKKR